ncbi:hypothetical protein ACXYX3_17685 [Mycobacterium sp. C3-094]
MAAAQKKAAKGSPRAASPRVVTAGGEPVGRFAQVLAETRSAGLAIEQFEITDDLVLFPPNKARQRQLEQASAAYILAQSVAVDLIRTQGEPPEDQDERIRWAQTQQEALRNAYETAEKAEQAFNEALFGGPEVYQRVNEYFDPRPEWERQAFENAINEQFRRLPKNGCCQACGQVVDQHEGESEGESSGLSSTSGTSSKTTSPSSSTEPTLETGSEDSVPGPSSSTTPSA